MTAYWSPCCLVEVDRRFRGTYCLHRLNRLVDGGSTHLKRRSNSTRIHSAIFQNAVIFILAVVRV
jgi:hypothetical protein